MNIYSWLFIIIVGVAVICWALWLEDKDLAKKQREYNEFRSLRWRIK